jgi:nucleoid-associated protein
MIIKELIVHLINKQADSGPSSLSLSDKTIATSSTLEMFLDEINKVYNSKASKVFGSFVNDLEKNDSGSDEPTGMQSLLKSYLESHLNETDSSSGNSKKKNSFVDYSHQAMELLKHFIDQASKATGGYILFVHYTLFGSDFMMLVMLNNVPGISVNKQLEIDPVDYLDISKFHLAARIDLTQWLEEPDSGRYISMIRAKESHKLSEYFRKFIGSNEIFDSKKETADLLSAVNQFCENEIDDEEQKLQFKQKSAEYCIEQADNGQNVVIKDFSTHVAEGAVDDFMNYVNSEQFDLSKEISPNKSVIRRFNKLSGRNSLLSITINEEAIGHSVIFDVEKETLTITELPPTLKAQLLNR